MDMQYQYTEKYVKDIAEAIRFIAGSDDTYSIKEMPAAIAAASPPMLGKPEDLFSNQFNAQLGAADQCFRWGIFSKYPDDSYLVLMDGYQSNSSASVILKGMMFNKTFTAFEPCIKFNCDSSNNIYFTRQEDNAASGVYLDNDGFPHIPKDLPFVMPTRNFGGWESNQGRWYPSWMGSGTYKEPSSLYSYIKNYNATDTAIFGGRFKAFGASNLNGRIPGELYSVISDGAWHTKSDIASDINIMSFINPVTVPSGVTIAGAHWFNILAYDSEDKLHYTYKYGWGGYGGPTIMYFNSNNYKWKFNTGTKSWFNDAGNLYAYYKYWRTDGSENFGGYGKYPWNNGVDKETITLSSYDPVSDLMVNWDYNAPRTIDDLKSYIPFRTYDILDQNGNVLLPANASLADFGIT